MTAQASDSLRFHGKDFVIAGVSGSGLFHPSRQGLQVEAWMSACWRGFICTYAIVDSSLVLTRVVLGLNREDRIRAAGGDVLSLFGKPIQPSNTDNIPASRRPTRYVVEDLDELIPFTGGLLLGSDFIKEMYVHMGFHPAYKYRVVHELLFEAGRLLREYDRSAQIAEFRDMLSDDSLRPRDQASRSEVEAWIERCFIQNYTKFNV